MGTVTAGCTARTHASTMARGDAAALDTVNAPVRIFCARAFVTAITESRPPRVHRTHLEVEKVVCKSRHHADAIRDRLELRVQLRGRQVPAEARLDAPADAMQRVPDLVACVPDNRMHARMRKHSNTRTRTQ